MGFIPDMSEWSLNMSYKKKINDIKRLKEVKLTKTDEDLCKLQNKDIDELKKQRLKEEKIRKIHEVNAEFGVKNEEEDIDDEFKDVIDSQSKKGKNVDFNKEKLWDMLEGRGLVKSGK